MSTTCKHSLNISPSGKMAMCELCGFVGRWRDGAWERVEPAASTPPSLGGGPFVVSEYVALPGDRIAVAAMDPVTGIMCGGRDDRKLAEGDAQALNAAYQLGKRRAEEAARNAYEHIRMAAIPGGNGHMLVPETAIAALRSALFPGGAE